MTVELQSYLIKTGHVEDHHLEGVLAALGYMERDKVLVHDPRLDAIKGAWIKTRTQNETAWYDFVALMDALTEESE